MFTFLESGHPLNAALLFIPSARETQEVVSSKSLPTWFSEGDIDRNAAIAKKTHAYMYLALCVHSMAIIRLSNYQGLRFNLYKLYQNWFTLQTALVPHCTLS